MTHPQIGTSDGTLAFTAKGNLLMFRRTNPDLIILWDTSTGQFSRILPTPAVIIALAFDGSKIATGSPRGDVSIWDASGKVLKTLFLDGTSDLPSLEFSPDSKTLVSSDSERAHIWDAVTGDNRATVEASEGFRISRISSDSRTLAVQDGRSIVLVMLPSGANLGKLDFGRLADFGFGQNSEILWIAAGNAAYTRKYRLADLTNEICAYPLSLTREQWAEYIPEDFPSDRKCQAALK